MHLLIVVVCFLALSVQRGESIRCYVCSSSRDPSCKDPFIKDHNHHKLIECSQDNMRNIGDTIPGVYYTVNYPSPSPEDFVCVKAVKKEYDRVEVVRSCTIPTANTFDVCSQLKSRDLTFCKTCTGDSCNGADTTGPRSLFVALLPLWVLAIGLARS